MASKSTAKKPAKPATKPVASTKPAKPPTAKVKAKPQGKAKPAAPQRDLPALKPKTGRIVAKVAGEVPLAKPSTTRLALRALRQERRADRERHEKPGTGRLNRGVSIERLPAVEANSHAPERRVAPPAELPRSRLPSPFPKDELNAWRKVLLGHRAEISQDIQHLEKDAMEAEDGHTTPNHLAERGSDAEMQDMSLGLAGEEQVVLWQIDRALRKIDTATPLPFGLCEHTKQPIPKTRLQLIPWTPVSIEGMNYVEENGLTLEDVLVDG